MKTLHFIILLIGLFLAAFLFARQRHGLDAMERMELSLALNWALTAVGGALAAISAFLLLLRAMAGTTLQEGLPLVVSLLGGLLLYQNHWAIAVALAAIVVAWSVTEFFRPSKGTKTGEQASS
jgi:hypothetical protein